MKGTIGTPTTLVYVKDKKKRFKTKQLMFCSKCRKYIQKGEWARPSGRLVAHYSCKK